MAMPVVCGGRPNWIEQKWSLPRINGRAPRFPCATLITPNLPEAWNVFSPYIYVCVWQYVSIVFPRFTLMSCPQEIHIALMGVDDALSSALHIEGTLAAGRQRHWKCTAPSNSCGCLLDPIPIDIWILVTFTSIECLHSGLYPTVMYDPGPAVKRLDGIEMLMKHDVMKQWNRMKMMNSINHMMSIYSMQMLKFWCWMMRSLKTVALRCCCIRGWQR
jgi:hypothetical protein